MSKADDLILRYAKTISKIVEDGASGDHAFENVLASLLVDVQGADLPTADSFEIIGYDVIAHDVQWLTHSEAEVEAEIDPRLRVIAIAAQLINKEKEQR